MVRVYFFAGVGANRGTNGVCRIDKSKHGQNERAKIVAGGYDEDAREQGEDIFECREPARAVGDDPRLQRIVEERAGERRRNGRNVVRGHPPDLGRGFHVRKYGRR